MIVLVHALCNACGYEGRDYMPDNTDLAKLRCPKCRGSLSKGWIVHGLLYSARATHVDGKYTFPTSVA